MNEKPICNECRTTTVCVDAYENNNISGRLYNPCLERGSCFGGLMEFLTDMDSLLDDMQLPQPFQAKRSFRHVEKPLLQAAETEVRTGKLATFAVRVLFRQNASWQGTVKWLEGGTEENFCSELELIVLMHRALTGQEENGIQKII